VVGEHVVKHSAAAGTPRRAGIESKRIGVVAAPAGPNIKLRAEARNVCGQHPPEKTAAADERPDLNKIRKYLCLIGPELLKESALGYVVPYCDVPATAAKRDASPIDKEMRRRAKQDASSASRPALCS
jgi:hypothetical protein